MSSVIDTPASDLRLVEETVIEAGHPELAFTKRELERMPNTFLRNLAAHVDSDEINGKSTQLEIINFFAVQRTLTEYEK